MEHSFRYDYGQTVRVVESAPAFLKPGVYVAVVGMTHLDEEREVAGEKCAKQSDAYLIEYADGSSLEVPEKYIETADLYMNGLPK